MTRKAILQIGTEKTGTTSLQSFLAANRDRLAERGYLYPRFCGDLNHTGLAAFAMDAERPDPIKLPFGGVDAEAIPAMRSRLRNRAAAELQGSRSAIFCSEHCHSRIRTHEEVQRLHDFLREFFDEIRVSVYLRRQDRVALSLYSTKLKSGGIPEQILPQPGADPAYYDYARFLSLWASVFGPEALSVRLYDRESLKNGNVIDDFLMATGIGQPEEFRAVADQNGAIDPTAQAFLRAINPGIAELTDEGVDRLRGTIVSSLERICPGRGVRPARAEAKAFYDAYRASNADVAAKYFPERDHLFDEDFSAYPEVGDALPVTPGANARVALKLLQAGEARIGRLEAEIAIRDAQIQWRDGKGDSAVAILQGAISRTADHAGLYRTLGEFLLKLDRAAESAVAARQACALVPENWEFWHFLGIAEAAAGELWEAVTSQKRAIELNPGHGGVAEALGRVEARLAEIETAQMPATLAGSEGVGR